ncbi:MAG TPA: cytochrome c biogenesis protein CcsA, partial [Anaeromyxobacteraceae bacterium]|nr:cytochrome c biogenesis protein CcsA [Anaeromyxobacteraceae bacterium]
MKTILALLSSLKLAVILLVLLLLGLAAGTIIETRAGVEAAGRLVYFAPWFIGLEVLFAANVLASIASLYPWSRQRIGYLLTHGSMLVILLGALVTYAFKTEGQIGLWEGTAGNVIEQAEHGIVTERHTLPFTIQLVDFQLERYQGTMRPSQFRSQVVITDPATGTSTPAAIWMNHPLTVKGYTIFQSSYQQDGGREASIFSVSKDPGQPIAFVGYTLLVLGMIVVLVTRIRPRQAAAALLREEERLSRPGASRAAAALLLLAVAGTARAAAPEIESLRRLPVQHDGRVMPFDTYARELVWTVTGSRAWQGQDPVETVAGWLGSPAAAAAAPVIAIGGKDLASAIGVPGERHAALATLIRSPGFGQLVQQVQAAQQRDEPRHGLLGDAEKLLERAQPVQDLLSGQTVLPIPVLAPAGARWSPPPAPGLAGLQAVAAGPRLEGWPAADTVERELSYNALRPTRIAWVVLLLALVASIAGWRTRHRALDVAAAVLLVAGFGVMTWGIGLRWAVADRIPASNMYESLLFLAWGVGLFAVIAFLFIRNRLVVVNASAGAALTMMLTDLLPMDGFIHPIAPVLSGTPWLAIHVPIIMVGYSVLALGVIIAHMQIVFGAFGPKREEIVAKLADLNYWYIFVGNILLIAGILTGSIWAASSWGRYWGWDPKEVWSLVAFLAYMAIIHGRVDRIVGRFGVAALSIIAFQTILMTYL